MKQAKKKGKEAETSGSQERKHRFRRLLNKKVSTAPETSRIAEGRDINIESPKKTECDEIEIKEAVNPDTSRHQNPVAIRGTVPWAIERLNSAVERLYNINHELASILGNGKTVEAPEQPPLLEIPDIGSAIDKLQDLTDNLISDHTQIKKGRILPATRSFLQTAAHALSRPSKVILNAISQGSSMVTGLPVRLIIRCQF